MDKDFSIAVETVRGHLESNHYSYSITQGYLRCYRLLGKSLNEQKKQYNGDYAKQWLQDISEGMCGSTLKTYRLALKKLDMAYRREEIGGTRAEYDARQNYRNLAPWCKFVLDAFADDVSGIFGGPYLRSIRNAAARFLNYVTDRGGRGTDDITHRLVAEYCRDDKHDSYNKKDRYNNYVCKFLRYLSDNGLTLSSVPLVLNKSVLTRLVFIGDLDDSARSAFMVCTDSASLTAKDFYEKTLAMDAALGQYRYSENAKKEFRMAWGELFVFLEANSLAYSIDTAIAWATLMRRYTVQWKAFRRAVMLFEQYRTDGRINPRKVYTYRPDRIDALPQWCKNDYESYIKLKEREGFAKSTLDMHRSACLRLMEYLNAIGIISWDVVTPETLKEFHGQDLHSTPEARNAYSSKIRCFLEYLADIGRVPAALFLAVPSESAPRMNIVKTLCDTDIGNIYRCKDAADSAAGNTAEGAMKLREAAMIMAGLRMGLRASDITGLKLSDISWEQRTISIRQQKTKKFVKLPMPVEVGNAIYRYITLGRPETESKYIFINHRVPYGGMHPGVCGKALRNALPGRALGFHTTRRTFASRMLASNVAVGRIAETLGHTDNSSVMTYLSTNGERMRLCAIPLKAIPVKGGALL